MELSKPTLKGLESLQDSTTIDDNTLEKLIDFVSLSLTKKIDSTDLSRFYESAKPHVIKSAYTDITSLFVESARHKYDTENLSTYLHSQKLFGSRMEKLCDAYKNCKDSLILQLSTIGNSLPCVIDLDWRLDYCIKSNTDNDVGECIYHIRLSTKKLNKIDYLNFTCSLHQLQELVYKLKDAARHMEKLSTT
ncbi:COMM domain-containing protein 3 [Fopius arisanus]|uniref:COMM domain-containing protein 3 n=1 Tax=Fopius arisanus TaxID=64838 RepID=A0A9R1TYW3_9HYME|nr:PREDICTED: COMM domain-containing protein 3 [Fopius arisanus]